VGDKEGLALTTALGRRLGSNYYAEGWGRRAIGTAAMFLRQGSRRQKGKQEQKKHPTIKPFRAHGPLLSRAPIQNRSQVTTMEERGEDTIARLGGDSIADYAFHVKGLQRYFQAF